MTKKVLLISGPSGAGKSFLQDRLADFKIYQKLIPSTTRNPRNGEVDGVDYNFLSPQNYKILKNKDLFLTDYLINQNNYCFRKDYLVRTKNPVIVISTQTILDFITIFPNFELVYLLPVNLEILRENMKRRGDQEMEINKRLKIAISEVSFWQEIKLQIKNTEIIVENDQSIQEFIQSLEVLENEKIKNTEPRKELKRQIF